MFSQKKHHNRLLFLAFCSAGLTFFSDQFTKSVGAGQGELNTGISFSLLNQAPELLTILLSCGFLALTVFVSWRLLKERQWVGAVAYGLLLGGGFSNLFDRWLWGGVRDVWFVPVLSVTNNLADWALFFAALVLIALEVRASFLLRYRKSVV